MLSRTIGMALEWTSVHCGEVQDALNRPKNWISRWNRGHSKPAFNYIVILIVIITFCQVKVIDGIEHNVIVTQGDAIVIELLHFYYISITIWMNAILCCVSSNSLQRRVWHPRLWSQVQFTHITVLVLCIIWNFGKILTIGVTPHTVQLHSTINY